MPTRRLCSTWQTSPRSRRSCCRTVGPNYPTTSGRHFGNGYEDTETGKTLVRPATQRLRADVEHGLVATVIMQRLDRLSRRLLDGLTLLADWANRGVRIVAVKQQVDMSGAVGRLMAAVLLGVAEMELELRRERQRAGIEIAKRNGKYKGRKPGATKADPERARLLKKKGATLREIAMVLGVSRSCVQRYVGSET